MASRLGIPDGQYLVSKDVRGEKFDKARETFEGFATTHNLDWRGWLRHDGAGYLLSIEMCDGPEIITLRIPAPVVKVPLALIGDLNAGLLMALTDALNSHPPR